MNKKFLVVMFGVLFLAGFVMAVGELDVEDEIRFTGKARGNLTLSDSCIDNGVYCGASYVCNFTIVKPDMTILLNNAPTNKVGNLYTYNLTSSQTESIGTYEVLNNCYNGTNGGSLRFYYEITPTGFSNTLGFYILILGISALIIILGFSILDGWFVVFGSFGLYFVALHILFYGLNGLKDPVYTYGIGLIVLGVAMYLSIRSTMEMIGK